MRHKLPINISKLKMVPEMQLVITENNAIIKTLTKESNSNGTHFVKSLQDFQQMVNSAITQIIEERGENNQDDNEDMTEEGSEDEEDVPVSPKKRKK